jgi:hypothetical protein
MNVDANMRAQGQVDLLRIMTNITVNIAQVDIIMGLARTLTVGLLILQDTLKEQQLTQQQLLRPLRNQQLLLLLQPLLNPLLLQPLLQKPNSNFRMKV